MSASSTNASDSPTARSITAWRRAAYSLLMRHFSSLTIESFLYDRFACKARSIRCSQPGDSRFSMILWSRDNILSWRMRYQYAFTIVKMSKYNFCISQASVATALRWRGQNYSNLRHVSFWCCMPDIIKIRKRLRSYSKITMAPCLRHGVQVYIHCESKKQDTLLMSITLRNINRFSIFSLLDSAQHFLQSDHWIFHQTLKT